MMSRKNKFDLTKLANIGLVKDGDPLLFVSDPSKKCFVHRSHHGEFKVLVNGSETTIHGFVGSCLGQEPPIHASKWLKLESGRLLYDLWQNSLDGED